MNQITVEDINTWLMKYYYSYQFLKISDWTNGDYGIYTISGSYYKEITLNMPLNIKVYGAERDALREYTLFKEGDYGFVYIFFNQTNTTPVCYKNWDPDWFPVDNPNVLCLPGDLDHKFRISSSIVTSVNGENVQKDSIGKYITYNALKDNSSLIGNINSDKVSEDVYSCNLQIIPSAPIISIAKSLYRGNTNSLIDLISLPSEDIEYKIYYQGKELNDALFIPRDYEEDSIRLRVVTKSYEPYIGIDVFINVPVETKNITTLEDFNNYSYGEINQKLTGVSGEINNDIIISKTSIYGLENCNLTINGTVIFEDVPKLVNTRFIINGKLSLNSSRFVETNFTDNLVDNFEWVNNGELIINKATVLPLAGFILNNGVLKITNSHLLMNGSKNLPLIQSTGTIELTDNKFVNNEMVTLKGYNICIIRSNDFDADKFLMQNSVIFNGTYTYDNITYTLTDSRGVAYCLIDDDTIRFKNMELK